MLVIGQQPSPAFPPLDATTAGLMEEWASFDSRPDSDSFKYLNVVAALDLRSQATVPPKMMTNVDRKIAVRGRVLVPLFSLAMLGTAPSLQGRGGLANGQVFVERGGCWSVGDDVVAFDVLRGTVMVRSRCRVCRRVRLVRFTRRRH